MYDFVFYQVRDVMTSKLVTVNEKTSIREAEAIFEEHDFNGLPVVDLGHRLIGMLTKLDLLKAFSFTEKTMVPPYEDIMDREISEVMAKELNYVEPETPLTRILNQMIKTGYKSFPVLEDDRLVGMVAREDILRALRMAAQGQPPERPGALNGENRSIAGSA